MCKNICLCYNDYGDIMVIDKIEKLKNNKYNIYINGEKVTTYDNVIIENNILYKKQIDDELYKKIINETQYYSIYNKVVNYILKKRRSEKEIREYLIKLNISNQDLDKIIKKLKSINLINDSDYARAYINDKVYLSNFGINKIKNELINQNISFEIIDDELRKVDENIFNDRLEKIIQKKINSNKKYSNLFCKQKLLSDLLKLGYEKNAILEILERYNNDDSKVLEHEFDKLYKKLMNKYNGFELNRKIEQKLLLKGFNSYQIRELIQKKTEE